VRLAGVLVAGQALLVAVTGWVTFTCARERPSAPPVAQLAAPSPVLIPPVVPVPARSSASARPTPTRIVHRSTRTAGTGSATEPAPGPASSATHWPPAAVAPLPPAATTSPPPVGDPTADPATSASAATTPPTTASPGVAPSRISAGQPCAARYALARATDGRFVGCFTGGGHRLRWKIV
jgi:hypothetical protein